jgi:hypothetical protein
VRAGLLWKGRREGGGLDDATTREGLEAAAPCVTVGAGGDSALRPDGARTGELKQKNKH